MSITGGCRGASAAFRRITLYLADAPEFIGTDDPRTSEPEFSFNGVYDIPTSVCVPLDAAKAASVTWFDLQGRPVIAPKSGMTLLRVDIMPDGSVRSKKVFIP